MEKIEVYKVLVKSQGKLYSCNKGLDYNFIKDSIYIPNEGNIGSINIGISNSNLYTIAGLYPTLYTIYVSSTFLDILGIKTNNMKESIP